MQKASQVAAIIAAATGVVGLALLVALERKQIAQWEIWNAMRRSDNDGAKTLVAMLRNDPDGRHTEDLVHWLAQQGKAYHELGRAWTAGPEGTSDPQERDLALDRTSSLALIEGYVGAEDVVLRIWPKHTYDSEGVRFAYGKGRHEPLVDALENALVEGLQNEVVQNGPRLGNDEHYERLRERARQTRRQMTSAEWQDRVAFVIAYIENIRADKRGVTGAHEQAVAIYERLLKEAQEPAAQLPLLVNLGIADLRVARRESSVEAATAAMEKWSRAERIASDLGYIGAWAQIRTFQTEADLLVAGIQRLHERRLSAAKRQLETMQDGLGMLSEGMMAILQYWLTQAIQPPNPDGMDDVAPMSSLARMLHESSNFREPEPVRHVS